VTFRFFLPAQQSYILNNLFLMFEFGRFFIPLAKILEVDACSQVSVVERSKFVRFLQKSHQKKKKKKNLITC
jgi:hypothetical protein